MSNYDVLLSNIKNYNFLKNSITKFCDEYNVNRKLVKEIIDENSIKYRKKYKTRTYTRDDSGKFTSPIRKEHIEINKFIKMTKTSNEPIDIIINKVRDFKR